MPSDILNGLELGVPGPTADTRVISDLGQLEALAESWDSLAAQESSPTRHFDWLRACAATFIAGRALHVLTVGGAAELAAVLPLVRQVGRLGRLHLIGAAEIDEPMDVLARDMAAVDALAEALWQLKRPLLLKRLPEESPLLAAIPRAYRGRGVVIWRREASCPWIPLDRTWQEPERHLNARRRSDLRRAWRVAEREGGVSSEILATRADELDPLLQQAFKVEAAGWKGVCGSALVQDPVRQGFYRRYAAAAAEQGTLRLCFLRIGGRIAAMQLAVERGDRFWLLKIGYDETFARCSPGTLLMLETLRYAAERKLASYELLGTSEPWTRVWTQHEHGCVSLQAYPATTHGMAALVSSLAAMGGRRLGRVIAAAE